MYTANYGFGNAAPNFNNPGGAPQPGMQPGAMQPGGMQPGQQVIFARQQQFAGMAPQGAFPGANPHMMQDASAAMMQSQGMPGMAPNNQMAYQQPFPGAAYQVLPAGVGPQGFVPNSYMMGPGMQAFPMGQPGMPQQPQMMQRMQPQPQPQPQVPQQQPNQMMAQVSTPQRPPSTAQGTPANMASIMPLQQPQFSTPQPMPQGQVPGSQHPQPMGVVTPQTPTFSSHPPGGMAVPPASAVPMSPTTETLEKERFALLLDINHELLYESIQIQTTQQELKREQAAINGNIPDRKPTEEENLFQQDYLHCMRRLQANLSYMAALADRKPEVKGPPCPAYLSPPPLNLALRLRAAPIGAENSSVPIDPVTDREERNRSIQDLYRRLQAVFPTFDPKKEPAYRMPASGQKPGNPMAASQQQASPIAQRTPQLSNMPGPPPMNPPPMNPPPMNPPPTMAMQ
ncbi:cyc8-general repressor of transcription [Trichoderma cornu-damae]|uniref:Cyc8-general repressor of transcription n=1 Tax=Trichoderma cornu-damae TaxID=654480 RepID=A0A9P8QLN1_9HYPO|nr:cyc8-general repressor of transcription [Trichoderma cornu-damae]